MAYDVALGYDPVSRAYEDALTEARLEDSRAALAQAREHQVLNLARRSYTAKARLEQQQERDIRELAQRMERLKRAVGAADLDGWAAGQMRLHEAYRERLGDAVKSGDLDSLRKSTGLGHLGLK